MGFQILELVSLFFFTMASGGFLLFLVRYRRGSWLRVWGIRFCHLLGFLGVGFLRLARGQFTETILFIISALIVSAVTSELANRMRKA